MKAKILLVEDDVQIAFIIKEMLEEKDYFVTWATTGLEGLDDFKHDNYDLLLVDLMLPEMDGFTLVKNIRFVSDVPILIISAKQDDVDKVTSLGLGADDYIEKPFSLVELEARVHSHLRRWNRFNNKTEETKVNWHFNHGLVVDFNNEKVFIQDKKINLTNKEFELLKLLILNPAKVFTKEDLYEQVWTLEADGDIHTVIVHIKQIREKLGDSTNKPKWIATVWGKGYEFIGVTNEN